MSQLAVLRKEFQKALEQKNVASKETNENVQIEKVLQPILEQITDETEGLLLQDLKQRWFKISLCTSEEIEEQKRLEQENEESVDGKENRSVWSFYISQNDF